MSRFALFVLFTLSVCFADPMLFVEQAQYDFGARASGSMVTHAFLLENRGNETLKIRDIKTSCGCTTPDENVMVIPAGKKKKLRVEMDLKGRSGLQTQFVTLTTNDPENRSYRLKLTGEAVPKIRVEPRTLNLMQSAPDMPHKGVVTLSSTTDETFEVKSVTANRDRVTAHTERAADGKSVQITVVPKAQKGQGHFTDVLLIKTSSPEMAEIKVLVMWQVSTGVSVAPGQVNLVLSDEEVLLDRYLMVRGYPGLKEPLKVTDVEWPGQDVDITFSDTGKFGWRIHLKKFTPKAEMKGSEIVIHTNAEGFERLKLPVRILEK
ncbi:DUF1573 domain-containing protein [Kiritimatiellaeota bacterium B1221]|nr:DUF1573 domain-containing protein [Kiritimatiellaeota bacterium B1221]